MGNNLVYLVDCDDFRRIIIDPISYLVRWQHIDHWTLLFFFTRFLAVKWLSSFIFILPVLQISSFTVAGCKVIVPRHPSPRRRSRSQLDAGAIYHHTIEL
jgi:hypothetical protein